MIAFSSLDSAGNGQFSVMHVEGGPQSVLALDAGSPAWSPDGTKIAFISARESRAQSSGYVYGDIYVMNSDGSTQTRLTETNNADEGLPAWSPDGMQIAYSFCPEKRFDSCDLFVMNADGSSQTNLTRNGGVVGFPTWSPDGAKIAFAAAWDGDSEIYVMNADGSNRTQLTENAAREVSPDWSPRGTKIAFTSCSSNDYASCEIYVMNADGSDLIQLTSNSEWEDAPAWSPDGTKIAFASARDAPLVQVQWIFTRIGSDLYIMNADGSQTTRLTVNSQAEYSSPSWMPSPIRAVFQHPDCTSGWSRLSPASFARVSEGSTTPNRVRSGPSTGDEIVALLDPGTLVGVLEGPVCADGLVFWKVEDDNIPGGVGWTAEGDESEYWLEPHTP